VLDSIPLRDRC